MKGAITSGRSGQPPHGHVLRQRQTGKKNFFPKVKGYRKNARCIFLPFAGFYKKNETIKIIRNDYSHAAALKRIRLVSVRSSHPPFKMHQVGCRAFKY